MTNVSETICAENKNIYFMFNNFFLEYRVIYEISPHVHVDFVVLPPGHGSSVTDF